ncbi:MAG TPA: CRISPR-associated helicase Cas3' [Gaiellaceae bacterium]|nr:CRISPR-associated helicase Cas3' [Gaiellaceae bacterium]
MAGQKAITFDALFRAATRGEAPFPWQRRYALAEELPEVVRVPTGAGKTEAAALGWLWRRRLASKDVRERTGRRLVYCLPMRALVEQTVTRVRVELDRAGHGDVAVHQLMGGGVSRDWTLRPEDDAVVVGTLDQLLSRALMRGYGVSRYAWPIHYALLHNDALWVFDEVQLMGEALATSAQLDGLRAAFPVSVGPVQSVWMSATVDPAWLRTVDRSAPERILLVDDSDRDAGLGPRLAAHKRLERAPSIDADAVAEQHRPGSLTLVIVNTVGAARELAAKLSGKKKLEAETVLLHSRFRPGDRRAAVEALIRPIDPDGSGRIAVATQVVEAGIDVSAATLFTEAAPWASLVQRFGRCNRRGELADARIFWAAPKKHLPYDQDEIAAAQVQLVDLEGESVGPDALESLDAPLSEPPRRFVLRRRDFARLFDTAPDLSGLDLDVQRYIRDGDDLTVSVAWRELEDEPPSADDRDLAADELCPAAIGEMRNVMKKEPRAKRVWRFDPIDGEWRAVRPEDLRPGSRLLVDVGFGCYAPTRGFDPLLDQHVKPIVPNIETTPEAADSDPLSNERGVWLTIAQHTDGVCATLDTLLAALGPHVSDEEAKALRRAARYHDAGKAHPVFQTAMAAGSVPQDVSGELIAKRVGRAARYERRGFRHELASLLSYLQTDSAEPLVAYLIASHHGRVRLGARSLPGEQPWPGDDRAFMLGCWEGDELPDVDLGGGAALPACRLDLSPLDLGSDEGETFTDMALDVLARLGPYRLSFLEAILRTADQRRSAEEEARDA